MARGIVPTHLFPVERGRKLIKGKPFESSGRKAMGSKAGNGYDSPVAIFI